MSAFQVSVSNRVTLLAPQQVPLKKDNPINELLKMFKNQRSEFKLINQYLNIVNSQSKNEERQYNKVDLNSQQLRSMSCKMNLDLDKTPCKKMLNKIVQEVEKNPFPQSLQTSLYKKYKYNKDIHHKF